MKLMKLRSINQIFYMIVWWKVTMEIQIILKLSKWWILMKRCSVRKFIELSGIIPLTNLDFERNIPIIYSFSFFSFRSEKELLEEICRHVRENWVSQVSCMLLMITKKRLRLIQLWLTKYMEISIKICWQPKGSWSN